MKQLFLAVFVVILCSFVAFAQENQTNETVPQIICSQNQCDSECVKCSDKQCHESKFRCVEELTIDKFFPNEVPLGETQINIVLKNTGNVNLDDIYATITGNGIETVDKIPLSELKTGDKDYVFAKINATKSGLMDIVIKLYVAGNVKHKYVDQIKVLEPIVQIEQKEEFNATELSSILNLLKQKNKQLEQLYQEKQVQGFPVDIAFDKLRQTSTFITDTESSFFGGDYKRVKANLEVLNNSLADIEEQLNSLKKQEETFKDRLKNNLLFYGSLAAALVSIFTAYKLIQGSIDRKKLLELHQKLSKVGKKKSKGRKKKEKVITS